FTLLSVFLGSLPAGPDILTSVFLSGPGGRVQKSKTCPGNNSGQVLRFSKKYLSLGQNNGR
ncbi:MAG: hypothetical protein IJV37_00350, partial [Bacteroidales bacterium]|nr:hypothetical protein [Bacteroidales bacterium]